MASRSRRSTSLVRRLRLAATVARTSHTNGSTTMGQLHAAKMNQGAQTSLKNHQARELGAIIVNVAGLGRYQQVGGGGLR